MKTLPLKNKIVKLETKIAFQEKSIEELNKNIIIHELEILKIKNHIKQLIEKLKSNSDLLTNSNINMIPPHY